MDLNMKEIERSVKWSEQRIQFLESCAETMLPLMFELVNECKHMDVKYRQEACGELMKLHQDLEDSYLER